MAGVLDHALDIADSPAADASALANTDELLSQLAGSEIDRILSEADAEATPPSPLPIIIPMGAANTAEAARSPSINAQLDELFNELQDPNAEPEETPDHEEPAQVDVAAADIAAEDVSATDITSIDISTTEAVAAESEAPESDELNAVLEAAGFENPVPQDEHESPALPPPVDSIVQPETKEKGALLAAAGFDANPANMDLPPVDMYIDRRVPMILKPLIWINAPFASCSSTLRNALGSIGVGTLITAVAAITYLLMTHKHR